MISKNFDLKTFKNKAANASDFLKSKGHDIPKTTLLHTLSVFLGEKNWNSLQASLKKDNNDFSNSEEHVNKKDLEKEHSFLNYKYDTKILQSIATHTGFLNIEEKNLYPFVDILNSISHLIKETNYERTKSLLDEETIKLNLITTADFIQNAGDYFKNLKIYHSRNIEDNESSHSYKKPYSHFIKLLVKNFNLIGDEQMVSNDFFLFGKEENKDFNMFFFSVIILLFTNLNVFNSGFQKTVIIKFRQRGDKMKISLYSFLDISENTICQFPYDNRFSNRIDISKDTIINVEQKMGSIIYPEEIDSITIG